MSEVPDKLTADDCFKAATQMAAKVNGASNDAAWQAALATTGMFWIQLGQFILELGDPNEDVLKIARRRDLMSMYPVRPK